MDVPYHVGLTGILALILYPIFEWKIIFLFVGGVLIDADHFLYYIIKNKDLNPINCYKYYMIDSAKHKYHNVNGSLFVFHTIEFAIGLVIAAFFSEIALLILIGYIGHWILDGIWLAKVAKRVVLDHSIIHWLWVNIGKHQSKTVK